MYSTCVMSLSSIVLLLIQKTINFSKPIFILTLIAFIFTHITRTSSRNPTNTVIRCFYINSEMHCHYLPIVRYSTLPYHTFLSIKPYTLIPITYRHAESYGARPPSILERVSSMYSHSKEAYSAPYYYKVPIYVTEKKESYNNGWKQIYPVNSRRMLETKQVISNQFLQPSMEYTLLTNIPKEKAIKNSEENVTQVIQTYNTSGTDTSRDTIIELLEKFNHKLYQITFTTLTSKVSRDREENGISFLQSGLFLYIALMALSVEVDAEIAAEIGATLGLDSNKVDLKSVLKFVTSSLPPSGDELKLRWSSHIVLQPRLSGGKNLFAGTPLALKMKINRLNQTLTPEALTLYLNKLVVKDSGSALQNTFEEEEFSQGFCAALVTTLYLRPQWRSAPTVLNGTLPFRDAGNRSGLTRMIRINDMMRYIDLHEWDAEAIEISYTTPGLTLFIAIPRDRSLRNLVQCLVTKNIQDILPLMTEMRIAVTLPLYTLRMTLLLPEKLKEMGLSKLINEDEDLSKCEKLKLSHAIQRLMFWSEAGRNAFKDDGIEWEETPELELVVDRPYLFFVRWKNITIMNGNFVL